jgi:hypothetical protein
MWHMSRDERAGPQVGAPEAGRTQHIYNGRANAIERETVPHGGVTRDEEICSLSKLS